MHLSQVTRTATLLLLSSTLAVTACKKKEDASVAPVVEEPSLRERVAAFTEPLAPVEGLAPASVALGERLYHDPNLSADGTISCASCHDISAGGDDGKRVSPGVGGLLGGVNSPTTLNSHLNFVQFWDGRADTLEAQAAGPIENPVEMANTIENVIAYLQSEPSYVDNFQAAFDGRIDQDTITRAIADYERTLVTLNSPFDQWLKGDDSALTDAQLAGLQAFVDVGCTSCHTGPGLGGTMYQRMGNVRDYFGSLERQLDDNDYGRFNVTKNESDRHLFKVPLLRNVAITGPYMHDGSIEDLSQVVRLMGAHQLGRDLSDDQVTNITAFLEALTGDLPTVDIDALQLPPARVAAATEDSAPAVPN